MSAALPNDSPTPTRARAKKGAARLSKGGVQVSGKGEPARRAKRWPVFVPSEELVALAAEVLGAKSGRNLSRKEAREAVLALGEFFGALREG